MIYLITGIAFGLILSLAGATQFKVLHDMFTFRSFHLYGVIMVAVITIISGSIIFRKKITKPFRAFHPGIIPGSVLFGIGWGLSGTCPGPAIIQIGEMHLIAAATIAGILIGNLIYKKIHYKYFKWEEHSCDE